MNKTCFIGMAETRTCGECLFDGGQPRSDTSEKTCFFKSSYILHEFPETIETYHIVCNIPDNRVCCSLLMSLLLLDSNNYSGRSRSERFVISHSKLAKVYSDW